MASWRLFSKSGVYSCFGNRLGGFGCAGKDVQAWMEAGGWLWSALRGAGEG